MLQKVDDEFEWNADINQTLKKVCKGSSDDLDLERLFQEVDKDQNGSLDPGELMELVEKFSRDYGTDVSVTQLMEAIRKFDVDGDGSISLDEWFQFVNGFLKKMTVEMKKKGISDVENSSVVRKMELDIFESQQHSLVRTRNDLKLSIRECELALDRMHKNFQLQKSSLKRELASCKRKVKESSLTPTERGNLQKIIKQLYKKKSDELVTFNLNKKELQQRTSTLADRYKDICHRMKVLSKRVAEYKGVSKYSNHKGPEGKVFIMFTDVKDSTVLWEKDLKVMARSIELHNQVIRKLISEYNGYEVKTEGDSFMIAFSNVISAVECALAIQLTLLESKWDKQLLSYEPAKVVMVDGKVIFRGLKVRIGLHSGSPIVINDPITGRTDYFGPVINKAARIEGLGEGGLILVSDTFWDDVKREIQQNNYRGDFILKDAGAKELKGIPGTHRLRFIVPSSLEKRLSKGKQRTKVEKLLDKAKQELDKEKHEVLRLKLKLKRQYDLNNENDLIAKRIKGVNYQRLRKRLEIVQNEKKKYKEENEKLKQTVDRLQRDKKLRFEQQKHSKRKISCLNIKFERPKIANDGHTPLEDVKYSMKDLIQLRKHERFAQWTHNKMPIINPQETLLESCKKSKFNDYGQYQDDDTIFSEEESGFFMTEILGKPIVKPKITLTKASPKKNCMAVIPSRYERNSQHYMEEDDDMYDMNEPPQFFIQPMGIYSI